MCGLGSYLHSNSTYVYACRGIKFALYPGVLVPALVACSSNAGQLITCSEGHWVDMLRSGSFILYRCGAASESEKRCQDYLMSALIGPWLQLVILSLICCFPGNVPLLHMHPPNVLHVMSLTWPSPMLVLQAANAGVRGLGYSSLYGSSCFSFYSVSN